MEQTVRVYTQFYLCNNFIGDSFFKLKNNPHKILKNSLSFKKKGTFFSLFFSKHKGREQDHSRSSSSSASPSSPSSREEKESKKEREEDFKTHHEMKDYSGFAGVSRPRGTFVSNVFDHSGAFTLENYKKGKLNIPSRL